MTSRLLVMAVAILGAVAGTPLAAQDAQALIGRWEPTTSSRGGIGTIVEFMADRKIILTPGALIRGTYTVDSVKLTFSAPTGEQPLIRGYEVKGDTLTVWSSRHPTYRLYRTATSVSREGLVGEWAAPSSDRVTVETYRADGTYRVWTQFAADTGHYQVTRNFVTIRDGRMEMRMLWRITEIGLELQRDVSSRRSMPTQAYVRERQ